MAAKANVGDGQKPCRQTNDVSSLKDESVCGELPFHLTKVPAGIVETAIGLRLLAFRADGTSNRSNPRI